MKKKEQIKLKEKSVDELNRKVEELRIAIVGSRGKMSVGKEKNLKTVKNMRRELAQTKTLINQMKMAEKTEIKSLDKEGGKK